MFHERKIDAGIALNVAQSSTGAPNVVLFHGLIRQWRDFAPIISHLTGRWNVAAVDHRGHGKSARAHGYRVADYAADAVKVVRAIAMAPVVLFGHSLGALTALAVAAECPDLVRGVVLEDPPAANMLAAIAGTNYDITWRAMRELARQHGGIPPTARAIAAIRLTNGKTLGELRDAASLRFLARCLSDLDPETLTAALDGHWMDGFDAISIARRVKCPALLLAGDPAAGSMLPTADADALCAALPDITRIEFPGRGHLLHGEHPAAVAQVVLPFLESL